MRSLEPRLEHPGEPELEQNFSDSTPSSGERQKFHTFLHIYPTTTGTKVHLCAGENKQARQVIHMRPAALSGCKGAPRLPVGPGTSKLTTYWKAMNKTPPSHCCKLTTENSL
jgi:hypothetical protein